MVLVTVIVTTSILLAKVHWAMIMEVRNTARRKESILSRMKRIFEGNQEGKLS